MKRIYTLALGLLVSIASMAAPVLVTPSSQPADKPVTDKPAMQAQLKASILSMTPAKMEEMTGRKMTVVQKVALKAIQKKLKKSKAAEIPKGVYILLAIVGLGWLGIGLLTDFTGNEWWISLLLYFLFFLPGLIYTLVVMKNFY